MFSKKAVGREKTHALEYEFRCTVDSLVDMATREPGAWGSYRCCLYFLKDPPPVVKSIAVTFDVRIDS